MNSFYINTNSMIPRLFQESEQIEIKEEPIVFKNSIYIPLKIIRTTPIVIYKTIDCKQNIQHFARHLGKWICICYSGMLYAATQPYSEFYFIFSETSPKFKLECYQNLELYFTNPPASSSKDPEIWDFIDKFSVY